MTGYLMEGKDSKDRLLLIAENIADAIERFKEIRTNQHLVEGSTLIKRYEGMYRLSPQDCDKVHEIHCTMNMGMHFSLNFQRVALIYVVGAGRDILNWPRFQKVYQRNHPDIDRVEGLYSGADEVYAFVSLAPLKLKDQFKDREVSIPKILTVSDIDLLYRETELMSTMKQIRR